MCPNKGPGQAHEQRNSWRMRWRFSRKALCWALLLFGVEVAIATLGYPYPWLRGFAGDLLAVVWLYFVFKTVLECKTLLLAVAAFLTGCFVELGQYVAAVNGWHMTSPLLRIMLGSVPDWLDVLAYALGFLLIMRFDVESDRSRLL